MRVHVVRRIPAHCMLATGEKMLKRFIASSAANMNTSFSRRRSAQSAQRRLESAIGAVPQGKHNRHGALQTHSALDLSLRWVEFRLNRCTRANLLLRFGLGCVVQTQDCVVDLRRRFRAMLVGVRRASNGKCACQVALRTEAKPARYFRARRQQTSASYSQRASW